MSDLARYVILGPAPWPNGHRIADQLFGQLDFQRTIEGVDTAAINLIFDRLIDGGLLALVKAGDREGVDTLLESILGDGFNAECLSAR